MVYQDIAKVYAGIVGILALAGLFTGGHLFGLINVDGIVDGIRIVLLVMLIYAGFYSKSETVASWVLLAVGIVYLVMGFSAIASPTLLDTAPSGLTGFDVAFHLITGSIATIAGAMGLGTQSYTSRT